MREPVTVRFGPWSLDSGRRRLARDGAEVHLTPKAFDLLAFLVAQAPRVVSKSALNERLWPGVFVYWTTTTPGRLSSEPCIAWDTRAARW